MELFDSAYFSILDFMYHVRFYVARPAPLQIYSVESRGADPGGVYPNTDPYPIFEKNRIRIRTPKIKIGSGFDRREKNRIRI